MSAETTGTITAMPEPPAPGPDGGNGRSDGAPRAAHPTPVERAMRGKAERSNVSRDAHGEFVAPDDRRDPVELLEEQAKTRVPELVPIRYGRMLVSPFTFFRGGAYLMAADLAAQPRTGLQVQLCGDAHLSNFGAYAAPDRRLVFSVNDFDETLPGPFEWGARGRPASCAVAGRERGSAPRQRRAINRAVGRAYRESMLEFAGMRELDLWYARVDVEDLTRRWTADANRKQLKRLDRNLAKTRAKDSLRAAD